MAKIQNNFLKGKMNKDLDERLVPKGEYREAQNIMISQSEGSDVGAIENVLGNNLAKGKTLIPNINNVPNGIKLVLETIGYYNDVLNKKIYWFVSNFEGANEKNIFKIKRAKKYHSCAILVADLNTPSTNIQVLVKGNFLNFSKKHLITGVNLIDDLLFWTDNYNQPRKINVQTAFTNNNYYNNEEKISVAKFTPYLSPILVDSNNAGHNATLKKDNNVKSEYLKENFVRFSYRYKYNDGEYSTMAPFTQVVFSPLNEAKIENTSNTEFNSETIERETTVEIMQNFYNKAIIRIPLPSNEKLLSPLIEESSGNYIWSNDLKISNIEILLKESDELAVKVVSNIEVDSSFDLAEESTASSEVGVEYYTVQPDDVTQYYRYAYRYIYKSEEPYTVLPESQTTRVYDHVPLRAKAQEISGNRIIYGNYSENPPLPYDQNGKKGINYVINSINKGDGEVGVDYGKKQHLHNAYKYNSLKQRRTYQVGVVLADKFGRQSSVILSTNDINNTTDTHTQDNIPSSLSSVFSSNYSWSSLREAVGKSLNINFQDNRVVPKEQVYNGDIDNSNYNPYGWYSWRLVVKQNEQEYYNVYSTHPADSWNNVNDSEDVTLNGKSWLSLHGDNINKVPRIVSDSDANKEGVSSSEIRLFHKVKKSPNSSIQNISVPGSNQDPLEVISIGSAREQGLTKEEGGVYGFISASKKNPSVAELPNLAPAGLTNGNRVLLHTKSTVFVIEDLIAVKNVTVEGNNPFIKVGQYVKSTSGRVTDPIVVSLEEQGGQELENKKTLRVKESSGTTNDKEEMIKVGMYVDNGNVTFPDTITTSNANGEVFRPTIIERERLLRSDSSLGTTVLTLDQSITCSEDLLFREFTKVKSINSKEIGGEIYQEIEFDHLQSFNNGDVLEFRNVDNSPVSIITGLSVFETEPFKSKLDIFYETSTSGLVNDLNSQAGIITGLPQDLTINSQTNASFNETHDNTSDVIGQLNATGAVSNPFFGSFNVINVETENLLIDNNNSFHVVGTTGLNLNGNGFVWNPGLDVEGGSVENDFEVQVTFTENGGGSATETINLTLENSPCIIEPNLVANEAFIDSDAGDGSTIFTCDVSNGSSNTSHDALHLRVNLSFPNRTHTLTEDGNTIDSFENTNVSNQTITQITCVIDTDYYYDINGVLSENAWNGSNGFAGVNNSMFKAEFTNNLLEIKLTDAFYSAQFFDGTFLPFAQLPANNVEMGLSDPAQRTMRVTISDGDTESNNWAHVDIELKRGEGRTFLKIYEGQCGDSLNNPTDAFGSTGSGSAIVEGDNGHELDDGNILFANGQGQGFIANGTYRYVRSVVIDQGSGDATDEIGVFSINDSGVVTNHEICQD